MSDHDRERMRATFESAVDGYERARPDYPPELYDALIRLTGLSAGDTLLEIGCATGKAAGTRVQCGCVFSSLHDEEPGLARGRALLVSAGGTAALTQSSQSGRSEEPVRPLSMGADWGGRRGCTPRRLML